MSKIMSNLQEGMDMTTVSIFFNRSSYFFADKICSIWESTRAYPDSTSTPHILTLSRAVHNFCTSQKAVSNSNHGVIGGAHRGGKNSKATTIFLSKLMV